MLEISSFTRPQWDKEVLTKLGASSVNIDSTVGTRIYSEEDEFYIPVPMFLVKVIKIAFKVKTLQNKPTPNDIFLY